MGLGINRKNEADKSQALQLGQKFPSKPEPGNRRRLRRRIDCGGG